MNHPLDLAIYMAYPFLVGIFVLGVEPLAAAILVNLGRVSAFLQHANVRTPRWLAVFFHRPEAHCIHHQRGLHRYNYSDLPLRTEKDATRSDQLAHDDINGADRPGAYQCPFVRFQRYSIRAKAL